MDVDFPGRFGWVDNDGEWHDGYRNDASRARDLAECREITGRVEVGLCMSCGNPLLPSSPGWMRCKTGTIGGRDIEQQVRNINGRAEVVFRYITGAPDA